MAFPFYFIGFYASKYYVKADFKTPCIWKCIVFALLCAFLCVMMTKLNGRISMSVFLFGKTRFPLNVALCYLNGVVGSLMIVFLSFLFTMDNRFVTMAANSLISILGFQQPILYLVEYDGGNGNYLISFLLSALIMIASIVLNQLILKICPELLGKKR